MSYNEPETMEKHEYDVHNGSVEPGASDDSLSDRHGTFFVQGRMKIMLIDSSVTFVSTPSWASPAL